MKLLVLSTCNNLIDGQQKPLEDSLIKHGYDYQLFLYGFIFGEQYKVIKTFVDQYQGDATHILYTDCWDTVALAPRTEVIAKWFSLAVPKMLISAEKAYFPDNGQSHLYPDSPTAWKYVNGGGCLFEIEFFKSITTPFPEPMMDPYWLRDIFLQYPNEVKLDYNCEIFQCLAHSKQDEWELILTGEPVINSGYVASGGITRIRNKATKTLPIFFHGNGRTNMDWVYNVANSQ